METYVIDMVIHLPAHQYPFLFAFSFNERMASVAQNTDPNTHSGTINGCVFTEMARAF